METRNSMQELNKVVVSNLISSGVEAVPVVTSSVAKCDNGRIASFDTTKVKAAMKHGRIPVMFGDVVFDKSMGFSILSGDQIVCYLSKALGAEQVIFTLDVDGIYDDDPKKNPDAKLMEHISFKGIDLMLKKAKKVGDVTGGMFGKLNEIRLAGSGVFILGNGMKKDWLYTALIGKKVVGTVID
jgi:isopentenyl phosphate kinase